MLPGVNARGQGFEIPLRTPVLRKVCTLALRERNVSVSRRGVSHPGVVVVLSPGCVGFSRRT